LKNKEIIAVYSGVEITFISINEASKILRISQDNIYRYLNNGKEHFSGYSFKTKK